MSLRIESAVYRAFEERHSPLLNLGTWQNQAWGFGQQSSQPRLERVTDFPGTAQIGEHPPSASVLLLATTQLALHTGRASTNTYRVRRDSSRSGNREFDQYYCPRTDYEFCFSALYTWLRLYPSPPGVLRSGKALHPATQALLEIAANLSRLDRKPIAHSREEYECLDDQQLLSNLISERMRAWYAVPNNKKKVKDWSSKHAFQKRQFVETWTAKIGGNQFQLLRFDLHYAYRGAPDRLLCGVSKEVLKSDIAKLEQAVESTTNFQGSFIGLFPYADLTVTWMIPCVMLVPNTKVPLHILFHELGAMWRVIADYRDGKFTASYGSLHGDYRYIDNEQQMFESTETQLMRAACYLFDTRAILDSSLEALSS